MFHPLPLDCQYPGLDCPSKCATQTKFMTTEKVCFHEDNLAMRSNHKMKSSSPSEFTFNILIFELRIYKDCLSTKLVGRAQC